MGIEIDTLKVTGQVTLGATVLSATAAELNKLAGTPAGLTATELGYLDGVTENIQNQLDGKLSAGPPQLMHGLEWNETADTYARLGSLASFALNTSPGNTNLPIHSRMRRCLVNDAMTVIKYLDPTDSTKLLDGGGAATLDGTDGQVMVEIPKFYYKYEYDNTGSVVKHRWKISETPISGYEVHPAFLKGGVERDFCYIGAYEASLYDTSASRVNNGIYLPAHSVVFKADDKSLTTGLTGGFALLGAGDKIVVSGTSNNNGTFTVATIVSPTVITVTEAVTDETAANTVISTERDYTATTGDKLSSVTGKSPIVYLTRANTRVIATNRGSRWFQQDFDTSSAIQLLFVIEYGSFNSQSVLGVGITNVADWAAYNSYNPIAPSGNSNAIGDASGNNAGSAVAATEKTKYLSYRGIENFWGHIWQWIDGISINDNACYVHSKPSEYTDDSATNYTLLGTLHNADGYIRNILRNERGFLPTGVSGGSSSVALCDYYYQAAGWRVAILGGYALSGGDAGAWDWYLNAGSGYAIQNIGARLACF